MKLASSSLVHTTMCFPVSRGIQIKEVKKAEEVREYQKLLSNPRRDKEQFKQLTEYLISPITLD